MRNLAYILSILTFCTYHSHYTHAALPCLPYFADVLRQDAIKRIDGLTKTQGDIVLFAGDSLTQMWTDDVFGGFAVAPKCGISTNSGVVDFTGMPGVKVNLGLSGIRTCSWLSEYQSYFSKKLGPFASRVKAVVINLGTNDVIQLSKTTQSPKDEVKWIRQLIDEMTVQFPNAHFLVHNISPCLNSACGSAARVSEYNLAVYALNGYKNTVAQLIPLKSSDMTIDQIHLNSCGYRKVAHNIRFWVSYWTAGTYTYPASIPNCMTFAPVHPCDL